MVMMVVVVVVVVVPVVSDDGSGDGVMVAVQIIKYHQRFDSFPLLQHRIWIWIWIRIYRYVDTDIDMGYVASGLCSLWLFVCATCSACF